MSSLRVCCHRSDARALRDSGPRRRGGEANLDILLDTIRANKKALVAANLTLTDEEAARFWPLYDRYQTEPRPFRTAA
jgi:hypothetical protein